MKVFLWTTGRWEARIGVPGSKHIYLGLFTSEREAAKVCHAILLQRKQCVERIFMMSNELIAW